MRTRASPHHTATAIGAVIAVILLLILAASEGRPHAPEKNSGTEIFSDGFEFGSASAWSAVFGRVDCSQIIVSDLREGGNSQMATVGNWLDYDVEISRTRYTFPLWHPTSTTHVDFFSISDSSHAAAYWDGTGYSPMVDALTEHPLKSRIPTYSTDSWFVDLDGLARTQEYWNGTYEVCLDFAVLDVGAPGDHDLCPSVCVSQEWVSTVPTFTPTPSPFPTMSSRTLGFNPTPTPTRTPRWGEGRP